jgi:RNA polymerase sigma-70 factor, ECF subfamily
MEPKRSQELLILAGGDEECEAPLRPRRLPRLGPAESSETRFRRLYDANYEPLFAFALRRCDDASEAHDVIADTFLVLWRRLHESPPDEQVPLWLYGVARRVLANRRRTSIRSQRLVARLAQIGPTEADTAEVIAHRAAAGAVVRSLALLRDDDREILLLAGWERLGTAEIAAVVGCSPNAAAIRLHRARKRLAEIYKKEHDEAGHKRSEQPQRPRLPEERPER